MTSSFFANTNSKIRKLKVDKSYPVFPNSGLSVIKRGKSTYFQGRMRFPCNSSGVKESVNIGVFEIYLQARVSFILNIGSFVSLSQFSRTGFDVVQIFVSGLSFLATPSTTTIVFCNIRS